MKNIVRILQCVVGVKDLLEQIWYGIINVNILPKINVVVRRRINKWYVYRYYYIYVIVFSLVLNIIVMIMNDDYTALCEEIQNNKNISENNNPSLVYGVIVIIFTLINVYVRGFIGK